MLIGNAVFLVIATHFERCPSEAAARFIQICDDYENPTKSDFSQMGDDGFGGSRVTPAVCC